MEKIREWKDFERADKIAIIVGVLMWAALETGAFIQACGGLSQLKQNFAKTEMVKQR